MCKKKYKKEYFLIFFSNFAYYYGKYCCNVIYLTSLIPFILFRISTLNNINWRR